MHHIELPSKPGHPIAYRLITETSSNQLVVFINGLGLPADSWLPAIECLRKSTNKKTNFFLYDRFGQGQTTSRDPLDDRHDREVGYGHDIEDCSKDLHELVTIVTEGILGFDSPCLIMVAASIGAHIARLYTKTHPELVKGLLILDSNIGHLEYSDLWPDPTAPDFDPSEVLEEDCTLEQYIKATTILAKMFNSDVKNAESLNRRNIKRLLPSACEPRLVTPHGSPHLLVVGHDPGSFAEESFQKLQVPRSLSMKYINTKWAEYNEGLLKLTDTDHAHGLSIAKGCGHFIQRDDPAFVASKLRQLIDICGW